MIFPWTHSLWLAAGLRSNVAPLHFLNLDAAGDVSVLLVVIFQLPKVLVDVFSLLAAQFIIAFERTSNPGLTTITTNLFLHAFPFTRCVRLTRVPQFLSLTFLPLFRLPFSFPAASYRWTLLRKHFKVSQRLQPSTTELLWDHTIPKTTDSRWSLITCRAADRPCLAPDNVGYIPSFLKFTIIVTTDSALKWMAVRALASLYFQNIIPNFQNWRDAMPRVSLYECVRLHPFISEEICSSSLPWVG